MKKYLQGLLITFTFALVSGCTTLPPVDFTVQDVGAVTKRKDLELASLTVGFAPQAQQAKKQMDANHQIPPLWKEALQDAINRSLIFSDRAPKRVNLSVRITEFDAPAFGASMETKVAAIYEIVDRENGDLLYAEKISSVGVTPFNYAFVGATRALESINRAVRNNISDFLNSVEQADLTKPVFKGVPAESPDNKHSKK